MILSRTKLRISQSRAKNCEEFAGNVRFDVAPQKPSKNVVKRAFETKNFRNNKFDVEKRNVGDCLKRVFAKFRSERSLV